MISGALGSLNVNRRYASDECLNWTNYMHITYSSHILSFHFAGSSYVDRCPSTNPTWDTREFV